MPKISGSNIVDHVATQEQAVFDAAIRLFTERGVSNVTTADIASEVGLARTSLYRYFPTKAAILYRWFETAMALLIDAASEIVATSAQRDEKLEQWVDLQLDFLVDADNHTLIRASLETDDMPDGIRTAIGKRHHDLYNTLHEILEVEGGSAETTRARVVLITGLLRNFDDLKTRGISTALAREELQRAAIAIAGGGPVLGSA